MSDQRITVGVIAQLGNPVGDYHEDAHQDLQDKFESLGLNLSLNHDGNIVIYSDEDGPSYETGLVIADEGMMARFEAQLDMAGIVVFTGTPKFFFDHWYDGCDSNHSEITLELAGYTEDE